MKTLITLGALSVVTLFSTAIAQSLDEEVAHLVRHIQDSDVVFIRNGKEHTPHQAPEHVRKKEEHFEAKIKTTEDFIELAATKSIVSGKPYRVRKKDGQIEEWGKWLRHELDRFRSQEKGTID